MRFIYDLIHKLLPLERSVSLKIRMRILLLFGSILPLLLMGVLTSFNTVSMYYQNTDQVIADELNQLNGNITMLMDSMKYMSQILINDKDLLNRLQDYLSEDYSKRVNAHNYLSKRIALYEASNPNINNITFFYNDSQNEAGSYDKINNSLAKGNFTNDDFLFSTQRLLNYYGPHQTLSVVSDYSVISMVRGVNADTDRPISLYIESGYNVLGEFSSETLDRLSAVYTVISKDKLVIYSSDSVRIPLGTAVSLDTVHTSFLDNSYRVYSKISDQGWALCTYVDGRQLSSYILTLTLGFLMIGVFAVLISIVLSSVIWRLVNQPLMLFQKNLYNIINGDVEQNLSRMHVLEFDESVQYFDTMKKQLISLVSEVRRQEQSNARLEMKLLMHKINPHFLHNTLHTLKCYAQAHEYSDIEDFISRLNRLLMYNMEKDKHTTLRSELLSISDYLALQKIKYPIAFIIENNLPDPMMDALSPRFILYPLVENAIQHGAKGEGFIKVQLDVNGDGRIRMLIQDSGQPLSQIEAASLMQSVRDQRSKGIGLKYVDSMLRDFFREEGTLNLYASENANIFEILFPFTFDL